MRTPGSLPSQSGTAGCRNPPPACLQSLVLALSQETMILCPDRSGAGRYGTTRMLSFGRTASCSLRLFPDEDADGLGGCQAMDDG